MLKNVCEIAVARSHRCSKRGKNARGASVAERGARVAQKCQRGKRGRREARVAQKRMRNGCSSEPLLLRNVCEMDVARSHSCSKTYAKWAEPGATVAQKRMRNRCSQEPALLKTWELELLRTYAK